MQEMTRSEDLAVSQNRPPIEAGARGSTLDHVKTTVADKLTEAADALKQKSGQGGATAGYADQASAWLNHAADYVRDLDPAQITSNIQQQVHNNPARSLLIASAAGLALGMLLRRR